MPSVRRSWCSVVPTVSGGPLAEEGWITDPSSATPSAGALDDVEGQLVATPPQLSRAWFDLAPTEVVAIEGLVGSSFGRAAVEPRAGDGPGRAGSSGDLPAVSVAREGAESAALTGPTGVGSVVVRPVAGGRLATPHGSGGLDGGETNVGLQRFSQAHADAISLGWLAGIEHGVDAASRVATGSPSRPAPTGARCSPSTTLRATRSTSPTPRTGRSPLQPAAVPPERGARSGRPHAGLRRGP